MKPKVQIVTLELETTFNRTQLKEAIKMALYEAGISVRQVTIATAQPAKQ